MGQKKNRVTLGILAAVFAAFLFSGMDVFAKALGRLGTGEITFLRGIIGMAFLPLIARKESLPVFSGRDRLLLHVRGACGGFGILFFFYSIRGLTLGDAEILAQLSAFFMCLLAPFCLKRNPQGNLVLPLVVIAAGAGIILQIWNFHSFNLYAAVGILSAFLSGAAFICIGRLTEKGGHSGTEIVFYFQLYSMLAGAVLMPFDFVMPEGLDWLWILGLSLMAVFAQVSFTWGCQYVHSIVVSFVMYTGILFHVLAGWLFWGEVLTACSWIGGALIVGGSALLLWRTKER